MTTPLTRSGGTAGIAAYFEVSNAGVLTISDGTSSTTLTPGGAIATVDLTATGNTTLGNAAADTVTITGHVDIDSDRTTAGSGLDIDGRINSASAAFSSLDITAVQLTTARTSGTVNGAKLAVTSLAGDLNSVVYSDLRCAAPTDGGGTVIHNAITVEAGHDALIDASAAATGESDIVVGDNLASAFEIREAANSYLTIVTTNSSESVTFGKPLKAAAGLAAVLDLTSCATGEGDVALADNLAAALTIRQGSTDYLTIQTTNDAEAVVLGRRVISNVMSVSMAASPHSLVYGAAGANQTQVIGNAVTVDAGAASRVLRLPPTADSANFEIRVYNIGSDAFEVASSTGSTIVASVAAGKGVMLACNGAGWGQILSA